VAEAQVSEAKAHFDMEEYEFNRTKSLWRQEAAAETEVVRREQSFKMAQARLAHAQAQLDLLKAGSDEWELAVSRSAVDLAEAQVRQVRLDLERLTVRAMVDGEVLQVNVRPGEYVGAQAGQALIVLGNTDQLHVRVDIDEYDIPRFRRNASALALLKGFMKGDFPLTFVRVEPYVVPKRSLTGMNIERVDTRVLQVIYSVDALDAPLFVGQQVDVFIDATPQAAPPATAPAI
jgi:multidrug resistance efflux pump